MDVAGYLIAVVASFGGTASPPSCARLDPDLIYCPTPDAPRITGLRGGTVTMEVEIGPDGSVRTSQGISSSGHSAWPSAAQAAVAKWRYSTGEASRKRIVPFDFQLGDP